MNDAWEINSKILREQYPGLLEVLAQGDESNLKVETAASGLPTLVINGLYVHSPRDPEREARRLVDACFADAKHFAEAGENPVVVLGFGLGYAAEQLASFSKVPLIIIEKNISVLRKAFELRDMSDFLRRPGIAFMPGDSGEGISAVLTLFEKSGLYENKPGENRVPYIVRNRTLTGIDEQWYAQIESRIRSWAMRDDVNNATLKKFGGRWIRNLTRNMNAIRDLPGIARLVGFAEQSQQDEFCQQGNSCAQDALPVFLAAAGPSLDNTLPLLPEIHKRCVIVAVDTSLSFLLKNGIEPDFTLVVDPQFWNSRHLNCMYREESHTELAKAQRTQRKEKVESSLLANDAQPPSSSLRALRTYGSRAPVPPCETLLHTRLIADAAVYPPVLRLPFKGAYLCASLYPLGAFIEQRVDSKGALGAGGSVATAAWDFARALGARQVWIAGLDLAFPGFKTHFKGAQFEEKALAESTRLNPTETWLTHALRDGIPFKAPALGGSEVLTDRRLSLYASWFEENFRRFPDVHNYALTKGGLAIPGLEPAGAETLLALPERRAEIDRRLEAAFSRIEAEFFEPEAVRQRGERYENAAKLVSSGLAQIQTACTKGAKIAEQALRQSPGLVNQKKVLAQLDEVNRLITGSEVKEIAGFLFPRELLAKMGEAQQSSDKNTAFRGFLETSLQLYQTLEDSLPDIRNQ